MKLSAKANRLALLLGVHESLLHERGRAHGGHGHGRGGGVGHGHGHGHRRGAGCQHGGEASLADRHNLHQQQPARQNKNNEIYGGRNTQQLRDLAHRIAIFTATSSTHGGVDIVGEATHSGSAHSCGAVQRDVAGQDGDLTALCTAQRTRIER
jgi:hypothetical protein